MAETTMKSSVEAVPNRRNIMLSVVTLALVVSVASNVLLAHRLRSFMYALSAKVADYQLKVGTAVPPIMAKRLEGQHEIISYQNMNRPTVLYIFTPPCSWCARNIDNFETLVDKRSSQYRFLGLSLSEQGLADYVTENHLKFPIYSGLTTEAKMAYKLGGTPQTIVISPEGRVLQNWAGAYVGDQKSQIEAFFHVSLPGLKELPKAEAAKN